MDRIALFVDNAEHAAAILRPLLQGAQTPSRVVLIACPPRLTRRIGKWVSHANREHWRAHWSQKLFDALRPLFAGAATEVVTEIGQMPPASMVPRLRETHGTDLKIFDARRPKLGQTLEPAEPGVPAPTSGPVASPIAVTSGICAFLALVD